MPIRCMLFLAAFALHSAQNLKYLLSTPLRKVLPIPWNNEDKKFWYLHKKYWVALVFYLDFLSFVIEAVYYKEPVVPSPKH